jgi:polysaccharide biosynthesis protein PslE
MQMLGLRNDSHLAARRVTSRDIALPFFRRRRLFGYWFFGILGSAIVCAGLSPREYESHMQILVKRERQDPLVTSALNTQSPLPFTVVSEEEINSEVALLQGDDVLEKVVIANQLQKARIHWPWSLLGQHSQGPQAREIAQAVRELSRHLQVNHVRRTNLVEVAYRGPDPVMAQRVLKTLADAYLEKHLLVHRPPGVLDFLQQQTERYQKGLAEAEDRLAEFDKQRNMASGQIQRDVTLQGLGQFESSLHQSEAATKETEHRIADLEAQLKTIPPRLKTVQKATDDAMVLQVLEGTLANLELKRTDMAAHFAADYRPLQELEAQIAQARAQVKAIREAPLREDTSDVNPAYQWVAAELVKCRADLAALRGKAIATTKNVQLYRDNAVTLAQKQLKQEDLLRDVKVQENNYLLYLNKREEARISDALDIQRIVNVAIAEAANLPTLPSYSTWLLAIFIGALLAVVVSTGAVLIADYMDPSLRTADEVYEVLQLPVLAALPRPEAESPHASEHFQPI